MTFYTRADWGASPPNRESPARNVTAYVFVHHLAVTSPASLDEAMAQLRAIQADHKSRLINPSRPELGYWADFAYNLSPSRFGLFEGRGWDVIGGGTGPGSKQAPPSPYTSWDTISLSLGVMGNYEIEQLDAATEAVIVETFREVRSRYGNAVLIRGDRDVNYTACCGANLYPHLDRLWQASLSLEPQTTKDINDVLDLSQIVEAHPGGDRTKPLAQFSLHDYLVYLLDCANNAEKNAAAAAQSAASAAAGNVDYTLLAKAVADELQRRLTA